MIGVRVPPLEAQGTAAEPRSVATGGNRFPSQWGIDSTSDDAFGYLG